MLVPDYILVSPSVPFFRFDDGRLFEKPVLATVLTSPAVNKGAIKEPKLFSRVYETMAARTKKVLTLAYDEKIDVLILGAWGCGVFTLKYR